MSDLFCSPTSGGRLRNTTRWAFRRSFWPFSCQRQYYQALSGTTAVSPSCPSGFLSSEKCSGSAADWQVKVGVRALVHEGQVAGHESRGTAPGMGCHLVLLGTYQIGGAGHPSHDSVSARTGDDGVVGLLLRHSSQCERAEVPSRLWLQLPLRILATLHIWHRSARLERNHLVIDAPPL